MKLLLAPMEGLLDHTLRDMLTRVGGVDLCVSEFIRVTNTVLPRRAFIRVVPELLNGSRTVAGVPVRVQLLGSDPACLADNAAALAELNPHGIDLNFGCPAKTVNQHRGGAVLLDEPELVGQIVAAVRRAVPAHIPVSAKMRLGYNDDSRAEDCAQAIEAAGASDLVVHARTKAHGYRPPAYWDRIADLRQHVRLPMVANGEIWTVADALRCREVTGCERLMIGRGMVTDPGLALAIARRDAGDLTAGQASGQAVAWSVIVGLMCLFWADISQRVASRHRAGRLKQWLNYMRRVYPEAQVAFDQLRLMHDASQIAQWLSLQNPPPPKENP
jgi:tRNA-dihydrouridine synthase C